MPSALWGDDVAGIQDFCDARISANTLDVVRVELEPERQAVNIVERRPPWREDFGPEWSRLPIARLRYAAIQEELDACADGTPIERLRAFYQLQ